MKKFYRVCNPDTQQGLWYDFEGNFTGLIHNEFNFCMNSKLEMDFDQSIKGWLSATDTFEKIFDWFSLEDILQLQKKGWFIYEYQCNRYRFYEKFQHIVIYQPTAKLIRKIILK